MRESEGPRMQHRSRRLDRGAGVVADVDALAEERMAQLGEMEPGLALAPRLQPALDERRAFERRERPDGRDGAPRLGRGLAPRAAMMPMRAAQAVAAVGEKLGIDSNPLDPP